MLSRFSRVQLCATLWTAGPRLLCPQESLGKNTGVGCHFLLQIFSADSAKYSYNSCFLFCFQGIPFLYFNVYFFHKIDYWSGKFYFNTLPEEGNGNPLQYSGLENPMDIEALAGYSPWGCKESDMT